MIMMHKAKRALASALILLAIIVGLAAPAAQAASETARASGQLVIPSYGSSPFEKSDTVGQMMQKEFTDWAQYIVDGPRYNYSVIYEFDTKALPEQVKTQALTQACKVRDVASPDQLWADAYRSAIEFYNMTSWDEPIALPESMASADFATISQWCAGNLNQAQMDVVLPQVESRMAGHIVVGIVNYPSLFAACLTPVDANAPLHIDRVYAVLMEGFAPKDGSAPLPVTGSIEVAAPAA